MVGTAKTWFDTWSLATKTYTARDILVQLLRRFAPQIQSLEEDARLKLRNLTYRMRTRAASKRPSRISWRSRRGNGFSRSARGSARAWPPRARSTERTYPSCRTTTSCCTR